VQLIVTASGALCTVQKEREIWKGNEGKVRYDEGFSHLLYIANDLFQVPCTVYDINLPQFLYQYGVAVNGY
jgi:hypothetical protein